MRNHSYDVEIVGAGVHGLTAAYHVARRGASTVVFERGRRAAGPTGLNLDGTAIGVWGEHAGPYRTALAYAAHAAGFGAARILG
ncbi:FAD-dependent oxidoreductase [Dactylosporangium sp. NPDC049140]|uniref:FAD-dependent oxidoreductase n=1 Tax=Dactylosporangium sp. NPDC049140 TaxID=3155647 RepID=UPI0033DDD128